MEVEVEAHPLVARAVEAAVVQVEEDSEAGVEVQESVITVHPLERTVVEIILACQRGGSVVGGRLVDRSAELRRVREEGRVCG